MKLNRNAHLVSMPVTDYELIIQANYEKTLYDDAMKALFSLFLSTSTNIEQLTKHFRENHNLEIELAIKQPTGVDQKPEVIIKTLKYIKPPAL